MKQNVLKDETENNQNQSALSGLELDWVIKKIAVLEKEGLN